MSQLMALDDPNEDPETHTKSQPVQPDNQTYHLHSISSAISIRQLRSQGLSFQLWPAAATLINFLDRHRISDPTAASTTLFNTSGGRIRLLELGSGTGVVGIAAAALFGASVTVTDLPHVLPNMEFNVGTNAGVLKIHGGSVDVAALSWGDTGNMEVIGREYDVIVGSDVVYHDHLFEPLLETLKFFMSGKKDNKLVFLMAHLKRWKKESVFFKKAKKLFDVEAIHTDIPCDGSRVGVIVYRFVSKSGHKFESNFT